MNLIVLKVFLLVSLIAVQTPDLMVALLSFGGSKKGAKEKLFEPENVKTGSTKRIYVLWAIAYILWIFLVVLYCFKPESVSWFWKISQLDNDGVKIFAIAITCLGYYLLMALGAFHMYKSLKPAINKGEKTSLVTTGIFHYTRNPMYLAIDIGVLATFLLMPNLLSLVMAVDMIAVLFSVSKDEEKRLLQIYGEEYEKYRKEVGMVFPKLKRSIHEK